MPAPGTEQQIAFAKAYVENGGNATQAALEAGYSETWAKTCGSRTLATPFVQAQIIDHLQKQKGRAGSVGLAVLCEVAMNPKAPAAARVSASRTLVEISGMLEGSQAGAARSGGASETYQEVLDRIAGALTASRQNAELLQ